MLRAAVFSLLAPVDVALLAQAPLGSSPRLQDLHPSIRLGDKDLAGWNLDTPPNPDSTDHLVFETVRSLLQHWPNTRMRNGHTIVPGIIPRGTLLYHGTDREELPSGPEWVALNPEHSYIFCREPHASTDRMNYPRRGCWHLTLATARPLRVVYFDGTSAAKLPYGPLDTQDLLVWGKSVPGNLWNETQRIEDLCEWGKSVGVDGFVRMEMGFEVMLCDFTSGVDIVSLVYIVHPNIDDDTTDWRTVEMFEALHAGFWNNDFPGESRIQLDLARLLSFYDTTLVPSLVPVRAGQDRWDHRVQSISDEDLLIVKSRLEGSLRNPAVQSSGVDWTALIHVIVGRFAGRLELTRHLLNTPSSDPEETLDLARKTQDQLRVMLTPYLLLSAMPTDSLDDADKDWTISIYKLCATTHTYLMEFRSGFMTESEKLILQAVRGTSREICRVVTKMWAAGVYARIDASLNSHGSPNIDKVTRVRNAWAEDLDLLMAWLDWSVWVKCDPQCGPEEICYLPTWPINFACSPLDRSGCEEGESPPAPNSDGTDAENVIDTRLRVMKTASRSDEWVRPQPKCIRKTSPYSF